MSHIIDINGPIVRVKLPGAKNGEQVQVGALQLVGEIIALEGDDAIVQVYESTDTLKPGDMVESIGYPLSVELGPGLLGRIFDGVQRPLKDISDLHGDHIPRGIRLPSLSRDRKWQYEPVDTLEAGAQITGGEIIGSVQETGIIEHKILVPPNVKGELVELAPAGEYTIEQTIGRVKLDNGEIQKLHLFHRWPVRVPRPYDKRSKALTPLMTGQRILDCFFPLLKGGKAAVPGPFGAGKTMIQQQIARWADADIVIYVGCGERGNELVDILQSFPELTDPHSGLPLMDRTLIIANTSNMPVVAREASIYVGVTLAEYYRDQGKDVVLLADSTSRWAEALREVGGRLAHMPVEEGYPAYLASRLAAFYERSGLVNALSGKKGSISLIGAVSPPGGDFSEPVTTHTKEIIQTFWALSKELADARHYPSVDWNASFSEHINNVTKWWSKKVDPTWFSKRESAMSLLAQETELSRIVNLVGPEALSSEQRWVLEGAALIREGVLQQSALDPIDSYASAEKQYVLLDLMLNIYRQGDELIDIGVPVQQLSELKVLARARRLKSMYDSKQIQELRGFRNEIDEEFHQIRAEYEKAGEQAS
ncbi:MAG: V-type ATP synthase subunit A [Gammaproteobacteria bacterium]|nr:MAG: V-type ATP synthase subunit A [Gammaproteobacteria bacterium]